MVDAGKILITPKGNWSAEVAPYEKLDLVTHNDRSWLSKVNDNIVEPSDEAAEWMVYAIGGGGVSEDAILSYPNTQTVLKKTVLDAVEANPSVKGTMANDLKNVNSKITNNLLNPSLQSQVVNGVTVTNNGDGTFTLNGTATAESGFKLKLGTVTLEVGKSYKVIGYVNISVSKYLKVDKQNVYTHRNNGVFVATENTDSVYIRFDNTAVFDNEIIKPMVTTNLSATYDDFVPYTGSTGKLNGDLAEIKNSIDTISIADINIFDEKFRSGTFAGGNLTSSDKRIVNVNPVQVKPNTTYTLISSNNCYIMDVDKASGWTQYYSRNVTKNSTFKTKDYATHIYISPDEAYGITYKNDISIIEGKANSYVPYVQSDIKVLSSLNTVKVNLNNATVDDINKYVIQEKYRPSQDVYGIAWLKSSSSQYVAMVTVKTDGTMDVQYNTSHSGAFATAPTSATVQGSITYIK